MKTNYKVTENEYHVTIEYQNGTGQRYDKITETTISLTKEEINQLKKQ